MSRPLLPLLLLAASSLAALAQETIPTVRCRTICFQVVDGLSTLYAAGRREGQVVSCSLSTAAFSEPRIVGAPGGRMVFYGREPSSTDLENNEPVAAVKIPPSLKSALLLFVPNPKQGGKAYHVVVLDDSQATFKPGGALVLNLYQKDVRFIIGEHKKQLSPGKVLYLDIPNQRDDFNMASVAFQFEGPKGWRTATENRLRFTERLRHVIVTYVDTRSKRPRLRTYRDVLPET